jgi:hypothetical protein
VCVYIYIYIHKYMIYVMCDPFFIILRRVFSFGLIINITHGTRRYSMHAQPIWCSFSDGFYISITNKQKNFGRFLGAHLSPRTQKLKSWPRAGVTGRNSLKCPVRGVSARKGRHGDRRKEGRKEGRREGRKEGGREGKKEAGMRR